MHLQQVDKFVLFIFCFIGVIQVLVSTSSLNDRDDDSDADYYYGNQDSSNGDVENLLRQYPENREMIRNIGGQYEVIYPIRIKRRDKGGISTREVSPIKVGRHLHRTSLLIKAFKYRFRVDLEINMELISPEFMQKHLLPSGAAQVAKQEVEHCFYHGTVRDMPGAAGAFYTCDGIAGVIHIGNETFIIHPFYGSDLQKPPHIIYTDQEKQHSGCGNTGKFAYRNLIPKNSKGSKYSGSGYRDKREQFYKQKMKYIEIAIIIDRNMFLRRNETSSTVVVQDALQIANLADLYFRTMNTRISVKYVETWQGSNQIEILPNREIHEVLESLKLYASQKLSNLNRDTLHLLSGMVFRGTPAGISLPESVCRTDSVSITSEMNPYEPHISASIMAHMVGHVIGLPHDPPVGEIYDEGGPDQCACGDWHGCVMNDRIVGVSKVLPFKFSRCSIHDVVKTLKNGRAVCLMNKPTEVSVYPRRCGNKITEDNEQCDCGPAETCEQVDPCCDAKTCKLKVDADCSSTLPCCSNCKILPKGNICRSASNECDLPEMCTGTSAECPRNIYRQDGVPCAANTSRCYSGFCPTLERQCEYYWGTGVQAAHNSCYETFNVRGNSLGNCGRLNSQVYVSCSIEDALCGTLQCTNGDHFPLMRAKTETSRNIITFQGEEHECKSIRAGLGTSTLKVGLIRDGTPCGTNKICVNQTCVNSRPLLDYHPRCPSRIRNVECSGTGYCTNLNHCFCVDGWTGIDCSEQIYTTPSPTTSTLPDEESEEGEEEGEEEDEEEGGVTQIITEITNVSLIVETKHSYKNQMEGKETHYGGQKDTVSTFSLVFVLTAAVKSVFVGFALLAICYRRSTMPKKVKYPRRKQNSQSTDDEGMSEIPDRPQVPGQPVCSCSPKKTKEARSYFRSRSKDTSTGSMTTDTSGQRTEDNARSTPGTYRAGDIELSDFSQDSLSKRGILKRSFRRDDHIRESGLGMHMDPGQHTFQTQAMVHEPPTSERQAEHAGTSGLCRESSTPGQQPRPSDDANMQNTIRFLNGYHDDIVHALQNAASKRPYHFSECNEQAKGRFVCKGANFKRSHSQEPLSNDGRGHFHGMVDSKTIRRPASAMHRREDCYDEMTRSRSSSQHELEKGAIRIRNIEDLIRQLEQHSQRHSGQRGCVAARIIRTKQKGKCMCSCGAETARSSRQGLNATDKGEGECQAGCRGECGDEFKFVFGTFKCPKSRQSSHQKGQSSENADYHDKSNRCLHIDLEIQNADSSDEFVCPQYPLSRSASEELMAIVQTPQNSRHGSPTTLSRSSRRGTPCPCSVSPAQEHPPVAHSRHRDDIPSTSKFNMPPGPSFCNINTSKLSSMSAGRGSLFGLNRGPGDFSQSPNANFSRLQSDTVAHTSNLMRMPEGHGFPTYHRTMPEGTPNLSTFQRPSVSTVSSLQTVPTLSTPANATHRLTGHLPSTYHRHSEDLPSTSTFRRGQNNEQSLATSSLRRITSLLTRHPHGEREDRSTSGGQIHKPEKYPEYKH